MVYYVFNCSLTFQVGTNTHALEELFDNNIQPANKHKNTKINIFFDNNTNDTATATTNNTRSY